MSVLDLKCLVTTEMDVPVERQRLMFKGKAMQGQLTICEFLNPKYWIC